MFPRQTVTHLISVTSEVTARHYVRASSTHWESLIQNRKTAVDCEAHIRLRPEPGHRFGWPTLLVNYPSHPC